jgi:tetratricopeptide (TPR) repeat protein
MKRKEYEDALERANKMPPLSDPRIMSMRMEALEETGKKDEARKLCETILEKHPDYEPAMEWKAIDIYERAESWYKSEMSKYNENADYTAYVYLRRELKKISAMYRESRDIFEKLHQNNPGNTQYIKYLKNIYLRLEMREEATKMDMLLENQ